jgi:hypothetical protein
MAQGDSRCLHHGSQGKHGGGHVSGAHYAPHFGSQAGDEKKTPHVQLVGEGALLFAMENGFKKENLLTPKSKAAWKECLKTSKYSPMTTVENLLECIKRQPQHHWHAGPRCGG